MYTACNIHAVIHSIYGMPMQEKLLKNILILYRNSNMVIPATSGSFFMLIQ